MIWTSVVIVWLILTVNFAAAQNGIQVGPRVPINLYASIDGPISAVGLIVVATGTLDDLGARLPWKFDHVESVNSPNFILVDPPSGIGSQSVRIGLNEEVIRNMIPGVYGLRAFFSTENQSPEISRPDVSIQLTLSVPLPAIQSVINAASHQPVISPGSKVSILGTHLGPLGIAVASSNSGVDPSSLAGTTVTFSGISAPLLTVSDSQIDAIVPYGVARGKDVDVVVTRFKYLGNKPFNIPLADTSPALFTSTKDGTGQGAILIYPQYSSNSVDNPARKGSAVVMFATGFGAWNPPVPDGAITLWVNRFSAQPVSLTIGGQPAELYYVGTSPYQLWGTVQVTAFVPTNIGSGEQPVVLKVGNNDNAQQKVTMVVQ